MSRRRWLILFALGLSVAVLAAIWVQAPGYMDADYYFATGKELASGQGFVEPFLWNYLDDPDGLPHPAHLYWMPLATIVAAAPMSLLGIGFRASQIPFVLLAASLPLLAARVALHLGLGQRKAWLAGLLACTSGFYLPYLVTTETFSLYAILGGLALLAMAVAADRPLMIRWLTVGALVGLAHMTRADGMVLLAPAMLAVWYSGRRRVFAAGQVLAAYALVMAPWWGRSLVLFGSPFAPGASKALWLVSYDELYSYPASILSPQHWWDAGLSTLLQARLLALATNLQRLLAENGLVFLAPFMIVGVVRYWKRSLVRLSIFYLGLLFVLMTFVLPQVGARGGFFHSSAALMPVLWALAVQGLVAAVDWAGKRRNWHLQRSQAFFGFGAILLAAALTIILYWSRVIGPDFSRPSWGASQVVYQDVGNRLQDLDPDVGVVAGNNPPGFHLATGLQAIAIPNGPPETLHQVVERYNADWIVLEENHPQELNDLYTQPIDLAWLEPVETIFDGDGPAIHLLRVKANEVRP
jgi:hypothetical protein